MSTLCSAQFNEPQTQMGALDMLKYKLVIVEDIFSTEQVEQRFPLFLLENVELNYFPLLGNS